MGLNKNELTSVNRDRGQDKTQQIVRKKTRELTGDKIVRRLMELKSVVVCLSTWTETKAHVQRLGAHSAPMEDALHL